MCVCGTYWYRSASLRGREHVSSQGLWRVDTLADFLLDEMHGEGKLLPGQLTYLPRVCQSPVGEEQTVNEDTIILSRLNTLLSRTGRVQIKTRGRRNC